jgi:competence protein ComEA
MDKKGFILESLDVEGAIESPGVYKVKKDSRVFEVLKLSGGVKQDAYLGDLNQASILSDGQKIYIPTQSEMEKAINVNSGDFSESGDDLINLNRATKEDLMKLPGIGEAKADSIIKYREKNGLFKNVKDITKIAGIKQGVYQKIEKLIKVD